MRRNTRHWLGNLGTVVVTVVVFLGFLEIFLRITGIDKGLPKTPPIFERSNDPVLSYQLKSDMTETAYRSTVTTDRRGFRSAEIHPGKPSVVLLGDSIFFGYGLEDDQTIGARLHHYLGEGYNVITAAAPGYQLIQEAALFKNKVEELHPDVLVLEFYWNDLTENLPDVLDDEGNMRAAGWKPGDRQCNPAITGVLSYIPGKCWLDLHSGLYRTIKKVASNRTEQQNAAQQVKDLTRTALNDTASPELLKKYERELTEFSRSLPVTMKKLFVIWPERPLHLLSTPVLRAMAERNGFEVLNLYEVFGNRGESLSWDTTHPSPKMADEAAAVIKSALEGLELLPN